MKNWSFGMDNDKLISLVLSGQKTATTYLYGREPLPKRGEESVIHFSNEKNACVVKTIDYKVMRFKNMTAELAKLEGEGDLSLDYWKEVHTRFFKEEDPYFNEDSKIVFEVFEVTRNLVEERLELGKKIANLNLDIFGKISSIHEINAGFNNTLFNVNDNFVIKVCTDYNLEDRFVREIDFYKANHKNHNIPKLIKYDMTKRDIEYAYEIIEKVEGNTLYYYWYKMDEVEREKTIEKLVGIVKDFHLKRARGYDWAGRIKDFVREQIMDSKSLFEDDDYNMVMESIEKYNQYLADNKFALIHNDLHFDNVIYNNGELKIIDFNDSMIAPIDFEFSRLYMCQKKPWKWANIEMDPLQKPEDYKNIWIYIKKYYPELSKIRFLEARMIIYTVLEAARHLKKYRSNELIIDIIENSKKLL